MKGYLKNILRGAAGDLSSYIGAVLIIALGVLILVAETDIRWNLRDSLNRYYEKQHFADVFVKLERMPGRELGKLREIEGVKEVFGRLSEDLRLQTEDGGDIVSVHMLAVGEEDSLNRCLIAGNFPEGDGICIGYKMFQDRGMHYGDPVRLIIGDRPRTFYICGTVQEPEYIYAIPPGGAQIPDTLIYDIACLERRSLENCLGKAGIVNELGISLEKGYSFQDVREQLRERLSEYGISSLVSREDQLSYHQMDSQFAQLFAVSILLPLIFFLVSAFMLYVVLIKLIERDRALIGTMKAFGFPDLSLTAGYLFVGGLVSAFGSFLGSLLSVPMERYALYLYSLYYNLPKRELHYYWESRAAAAFLSLMISLAAVLAGVRGILKVHPAESMRGAVPEQRSGRKLPDFLRLRLSPAQRMSLRFMLRNKRRNLLAAFAAAFPFALSSVIFSFNVIAEHMYTMQFTKVELYDMKLSLDGFKDRNNMENSMRQIAGIYELECEARYSVSLEHENHSLLSSLTAFRRDSDEHRLADCYGKEIRLRSGGLVINSITAGKLGIRAGEELSVYNPYLAKNKVSLPVVYVAEESFGGGCYIDIDEMYRYFPKKIGVNELLFKVQRGEEQRVRKILSETSSVRSLTESSRVLKSYRSLIDSMSSMMTIFSSLSVAMGFVLIINIRNILLRERRNEFGTLLLFGTPSKELRSMILWEELADFSLGIIIGFPLSFLVRDILSKILSSDAYLLKFHVPPTSYLKGFLLCASVSALSLLFSFRSLGAIDVAEVLKERE